VIDAAADEERKSAHARGWWVVMKANAGDFPRAPSVQEFPGLPQVWPLGTFYFDLFGVNQVSGSDRRLAKLARFRARDPGFI